MKKRKIQKIISSLLIILMMMTIFANIASATQIVDEIVESTAEQAQVDSIWDGIGGLIDGVVGLLTAVLRIPFLLIAMAIQGILTGIATLGGSEIEGLITPDDIFFNHVGLTNIDFFDLTGNASAIQTMRTNVATWYYVFRILAIVILLVVLIYIGIRMAVSTVASEQAQYKRMLTDWVVSFALIFLLNYIIMFTLEANNGLIGLLEKPVRTKMGNGIATQLITRAALGKATVSWAALIVYCFLIGMTTAFLFSYIKRMLTIGFLIIISPLITITYSIDKVKDGRAQALNTWLKEFMFTVLIQPFHCIIYIVFVSTSIDLLAQGGSIPKMVLSIVCMSFIWKAEKIVKKIFGFDAASTSLGDTIASMAIVKQIGQVAAKAGSAGGKAIKNTTFGRNITNNINTRLNSSAGGRALRNIANSKPGNFIKSVGIPVTAGIAAASFEKGLNSPANAGQVGLETYTAAKTLMVGNPGSPGSKQSIQLSEKDLQRYANLIANNNNFNFANFSTNQTNKNNLKAYAQSLITSNMDVLNNDIQNALHNLRTANPADYDMTTAAGMRHLNDLMDMALDDHLDFNDPSTNPLGHAWSAEERQVVTAIQIRNLAQAVQGTHTQYQAAGHANPDQDIDDYIQGL